MLQSVRQTSVAYGYAAWAYYERYECELDALELQEDLARREESSLPLVSLRVGRLEGDGGE